jgi:hypothetical protein
MSFQNRRGNSVSLSDRLSKFSQVIYELDPITLKSPHDDEYDHEALYIMSTYSHDSIGVDLQLARKIVKDIFDRQFYYGAICHDDVDIIAQHLVFIHECRKWY